jgi:hypothetical protein
MKQAPVMSVPAANTFFHGLLVSAVFRLSIPVKAIKMDSVKDALDSESVLRTLKEQGENDVSAPRSSLLTPFSVALNVVSCGNMVGLTSLLVHCCAQTAAPSIFNKFPLSGILCFFFCSSYISHLKGLEEKWSEKELAVFKVCIPLFFL